MNIFDNLENCCVMRYRDIVLNLTWIVLTVFIVGLLIGSEK